MRPVRYFILLCSAILLWLTACTSQQKSSNIITVTIEPQRYFAEKIAKDKFTIHTMVPAGQNPESYDPTPSQMVKVGQSAAYFKIGYIGFEKAWMGNIAANNPKLAIFDLSEGMPLIKGEEHVHNQNGHRVVHKEETDPHIWNSIKGARVIARNMLNAFIRLDKGNTSFYQQNYEELVREIDRIEQQMKKELNGLANRTFIIYHPALTYFAEEYNLKQLCIEMDGKEPSPAQLKQLVDTAREHQAKVVFVQKEFDSKNAMLISQETGCQLISINPLNYEWDKEMIQIAKALSDGKTN